ncbi:MAG: ABC transporter permease [Clostridia bacterium]|nr:ABC transporter permease [Clostridia bacterium]
MGKFKSFGVRLRFSMQMAFHGVMSNPLRSILTILGVTIGVAAVVSLMGIGEGARSAVVAQFESLGSNVVMVKSTDKATDFKPDLAYELKERVNTLTAMTPVAYGSADMKWRRSRGTISVIGVNSEFPYIRDHTMIAGNFFNEVQVGNNSKVAVLGYNLAAKLQGGRSPVGQTLTLNGYEYRIIGVLSQKGDGKGEGIDDKIVVPYTTAKKITKKNTVTELWGKTESSRDSELAVVQLSRIFRQKLGLENGANLSGSGNTSTLLGNLGNSGNIYQNEDVTVTVTSLDQMVEEADQANRIMSLLLGGIAAVSLLVGGLGIMNIMLVAVTERTGEIGVRRALGARQGDLIVQFMLESLYLSGIGAIVGVVLGVAGMDLFARYGFDAIVSFTAIRVAVSVALGCGVVFGVYPAINASMVPPVEALRSN